MFQFNLKKLGLIGAISILLSACSDNNNPLLHKSGKAAFVPTDDVVFSDYVTKSQQNIEQVLKERRLANRHYLGDYTLAEAAAMRSPFQVPKLNSDRCTDASQGANKGFLLVHGLTDSPYLMRSISQSLSQANPCSLIRAVLLPGHGTIVGDTLDMQYKDWNRIVEYGVNTFQTDATISELYLVGFSTGTSLSINYIKQHPETNINNRNDKIKGLVLLSVAVKAHDSKAWLAPWVSIVENWDSTFKEQDAARYESFSYNAGGQFYTLTKDMTEAEYILDVPVLMAVSADDQTINANAARTFFCQARNERRALIWYQSIDPSINTEIANDASQQCKQIINVQLDTLEPQFKTVNLAHTALSIQPDDPHYGVKGKYHQCKKYADKDKVLEACQNNDQKSVFGENNVDKLKGDIKPSYTYLRRGTFNPDYAHLESRILCFTDSSCSNSDLVSSAEKPNAQLINIQ
jgi:esterase/lipase